MNVLAAGEDGATCYASVIKANLISFVVDGSTTVTSHCVLSPSVSCSVITSILSIQIPSDE